MKNKMSDDRTFNVKAPRNIIPCPNGQYKGVIETVDYRDVNYQGQVITYADINVKIEEIKDAVVTVGYSTNNVSPSTQLGKFLSLFKTIKEGENINPKQILIGRKVSLMVMNQPGKKDATKMYPVIVKGSIVPIN